MPKKQPTSTSTATNLNEPAEHTNKSCKDQRNKGNKMQFIVHNLGIELLLKPTMTRLLVTELFLVTDLCLRCIATIVLMPLSSEITVCPIEWILGMHSNKIILLDTVLSGMPDLSCSSAAPSEVKLYKVRDCCVTMWVRVWKDLLAREAHMVVGQVQQGADVRPSRAWSYLLSLWSGKRRKRRGRHEGNDDCWCGF
jgi:hypothetical protein